MLVFQTDWDHIKDGCKRAGFESNWLVEVVAEINLYLPDDWRLTRSKNNFRIDIVAEHSATLVGFGFRVNGDEILNIIDSVHKKEFIDVVDLREKQANKKGKLDASLKKKNPEALVPNLYFFRPCPPDSITPLFARQYERLKKKGSDLWAGDQYHRIHPLTKSGLDLLHFRWVRWDINGNVEFAETVRPEYHGKDYWNIKPLKDNIKRTSAENYKKQYFKILENEQVAPPEPAEKPSIPYEIEYKFLVPSTPDEAHLVFQTIEDNIRETGFTISKVPKR